MFLPVTFERKKRRCCEVGLIKGLICSFFGEEMLVGLESHCLSLLCLELETKTEFVATRVDIFAIK